MHSQPVSALSLALPPPTPSPAASPASATSPPTTSPGTSCPDQTPSLSSISTNSRVLWGPPGGGGTLVAPPAVKPGWAFTRAGERARSPPLGNFPAASSRLAVLFPPLTGSFGLPTSSVLLAFHSHAGVDEMEKEPLPGFVSGENLAHALWTQAWCSHLWWPSH